MSIAVALVISAVVHLRLAPGYQAGSSGGIGTGTLFRIEAMAAILAAVLVLVIDHRVAYLTAFAVAAGAFGAVVLYRYVDVPAIGPLPAMYEPVWFFEKAVSAVAEAVAAGLALLGLSRTPTAAKTLPVWPWSPN